MVCWVSQCFFRITRIFSVHVLSGTSISLRQDVCKCFHMNSTDLILSKALKDAKKYPSLKHLIHSFSLDLQPRNFVRLLKRSWIPELQKVLFVVPIKFLLAALLRWFSESCMLFCTGKKIP